jgi:hypothetical protein
MWMQLTGFTMLALVGAGLAATPGGAAAPPAPVSSITVTPKIDSSGTSSVDVSWTGADPKADGVLVCVRRGTTTPSSPTGCESQIAVDAPRTSSGPITVYPKKTYTIAVYDYIGTTPEPTYSTPVSKVRHGTSMTLHETCANGQDPGDSCRITGVLKDVFRGTTIGHRQVELWASRNLKQSSSWSRVATDTTDSYGLAKTRITLDKSRLYQWRYAAVSKRQLTTYTAQVGIVVAS